MSTQRIGPFLLLLSLFLITSCAGGGYVSKSRGARYAFQQGNYDNALRWYQKQNPPARDKLLYLMDEGVILHSAGKFNESLKIFQEAIDLSEKMEGAQVATKAASLVTNDNFIPYQGEKFETLLLHVFQVMNYLGLGQNNEALVEVRRIQTKFSNYFTSNAKDYLQNAFAIYLSALVWEANHKLNDAYIDYKTTYRLSPLLPYLPEDLLKTSSQSGLLEEYARWKKSFKTSYAPSHKNDGEVILFLEEGRVPEKISSEINEAFQIVPVPIYPELVGEAPQISVLVDGKETSSAFVLYRPDQAARKTLADQKAAIVARAIARLAAKEGAAIAVSEKVDQDLGFFLGILLLTTNRADLRSWLTLPRSFQMFKISLPAGSHTLKIISPGGTKLLTAEVKIREKTFLSCRIF